MKFNLTVDVDVRFKAKTKKENVNVYLCVGKYGIADIKACSERQAAQEYIQRNIAKGEKFNLRRYGVDHASGCYHEANPSTWVDRRKVVKL